MFCYQPEKTDPYYVAGVFNSRTELMTQEKFMELLTSPQTQWLVTKHREVKRCLDDPKWLEDEDFMAYDRKQKARPKSREGKIYANLADDGKRVAMWCDSLKKRLPFVIFIGTYPERAVKDGGEVARWRNQKFIELNGLDVLDFDHVAKEKTVTQIWDDIVARLSEEDRARVVMAFVSPGGDGLKVVFKADPAIGNLIDNQIDFGRKCGLTLDQSCKDAARGTFLTTVDDILYMNNDVLFNYEDKTFHEKFAAQYHRGDSQPTLPFAADGTDSADSRNLPADAVPVAPAGNGGDGGAEDAGALTYHGVAYAKIVDSLLDGKEPGEGDRHATSLKLASDLRYITDNDPKLIEQILRSLPWVDDIVKARGEDVAGTVKSAMEYKYCMTMPKRIAEALVKAGVDLHTGSVPLCNLHTGSVPLCNSTLEEWGGRIEALFGEYPCLKEICHGLQPSSYAAALFVAAAFLGTDMTRTWYYFYHRPEELRRLNYCIMVIGDPASGKSFATRLYKLLAAPMLAADKVGNDAVNRYKQELKKRSSSSKEQKKEGLTEPEVVVRCLGSRTANGVFIKNMNRAVETIDGQPLHLHLLTFDSELDSATMASRGGQWIDKSVMELKAFHNEQDDQQYGNVDSMNGPFDVYWNYVYTGTPLSLSRKVTERNFGSGLSTRLAVIPMPPSKFKMMELKRVTKTDHTADETLKQWAFRLDGVKGELPLWPLVENVWQWANDRLQVAEFNQDRADELLIKRVPYYGITVAAPFILMRHWKEWEEKNSFEIDATDRQLSTLIMDIQYASQWYYFGEMARQYFDNMHNKEQNSRRRPSKYDYCYEQMPQMFTLDDVVKCYGIDRERAYSTVKRLKEKGYIASPKTNNFVKLKNTLL